MQKIKLWGILILSSLVISACAETDDDDFTAAGYFAFDEIALSSKNQVPPVEGRITNGTAKITIDKNFVLFNIKVKNVSGDDTLTAAHIHLGAPDANGDVLLGLVDGTSISFEEGEASGVLKVKDKIISRLKKESTRLYVNVHSTKHPPGLVRGTLR